MLAAHTKARRRMVAFVVIALAVVVFDQLTKALARTYLVEGEPVTLIPGIMDLSLTHNTGAAFSLGQGAGALFVAFAVAIFVAGLVFAARVDDAPSALLVSFACVAGGGIGNGIDRVVLGSVTDFFKTTFVDFAVFNVADAFITCFVVIGFVIWWRWDSAREVSKSDGEPDGAGE